MKNFKQTQVNQEQSKSICKAGQMNLQSNYDITTMSTKAIEDFNQKLDKFSKTERKRKKCRH